VVLPWRTSGLRHPGPRRPAAVFWSGVCSAGQGGSSTWPPHRDRAMERQRCLPWVGGVGVAGAWCGLAVAVPVGRPPRRHGLRRCCPARGIGVDLRLGVGEGKGQGSMPGLGVSASPWLLHGTRAGSASRPVVAGGCGGGRGRRQGKGRVFRSSTRVVIGAYARGHSATRGHCGRACPVVAK